MTRKQISVISGPNVQYLIGCSMVVGDVRRSQQAHNSKCTSQTTAEKMRSNPSTVMTASSSPAITLLLKVANARKKRLAT
jgi:hypothetical protein